MNNESTPSRNSASENIRQQSLAVPNLNPNCLGLAFGVTGLVFYLGCMITMATVPREMVVVLSNSLLHGFDVEPILKTTVPISQVALGLVTTFIFGWLGGGLIAVLYNLSLRLKK